MLKDKAGIKNISLGLFKVAVDSYCRGQERGDIYHLPNLGESYSFNALTKTSRDTLDITLNEPVQMLLS